MNILALDSSATSASVALVEDEKLVAEYFVNANRTHSTTLVPMVKSLLEHTQRTMSDINYFAVSSGPGSFTGLRIGIAAVKGMAFAEQKLCVGVSTLESMAYNMQGENCVVCAVMDARCSQFYNALFRVEKNKVTRLCEDRALSAEDLKQELLNEYNSEKIVLAGDGGALAYSQFAESLPGIEMAPYVRLYQRASGVALAAQKQILQEKYFSASELLPVYLRLPQAQRELNKKSLNKKI